MLDKLRERSRANVEAAGVKNRQFKAPKLKFDPKSVKFAVVSHKFASVAVASCVVLALLMTFMGWSMRANALTKLHEAEATLVSKQNEVATLKAASNNADTEMLTKTTGIDMNRVTDDTQAVKNLAELVYTWDSYAAYNKAREAVAAAGQPADGVLLTKALPEQVTLKFKDKHTGAEREVNDIDAYKLNSKLGGVTMYPLAINGDQYKYLVAVEVTSKGANSDSSSTGTVMWQVVTSGDHKVEVTDVANTES